MNKLVLTTNDPNVVTKVQLFAQAEGITLEVQNTSNVVPFLNPAQDKVETMANLEKSAIENSIKQNRGNLSQAAKTLGIGRATLYRKVKQYSIETVALRKAA